MELGYRAAAARVNRELRYFGGVGRAAGAGAAAARARAPVPAPPFPPSNFPPEGLTCSLTGRTAPSRALTAGTCAGSSGAYASPCSSSPQESIIARARGDGARRCAGKREGRERRPLAAPLRFRVLIRTSPFELCSRHSFQHDCSLPLSTDSSLERERKEAARARAPLPRNTLRNKARSCLDPFPPRGEGLFSVEASASSSPVGDASRSISRSRKPIRRA